MTRTPPQRSIDMHMRATCRMLASPFTAAGLAEEIGMHINSAYKLIREGQANGFVHCIQAAVRREGKNRGLGFLYEARNPFVDQR